MENIVAQCIVNIGRKSEMYMDRTMFFLDGMTR